MKLCDINPHLRFAAHLHYAARPTWVKTTDCRLFYITDGEAQLTVGGESYSLRPNSLFYCCAGNVYRIETTGGMDLICLNFDLTQVHNQELSPIPRHTDGWDSVPVYRDLVADSSILNGVYLLPEADILSAPLHRIADEFSSGDPLSREFSSCILKEVLLNLHRLAPGKLPSKLLQVQAYIDGHYHTDISNCQLAAMAGYHEVYLNRIFQAHLGCTLHGYLLRVRLNHASRLILSSDLPLKEISQQIGFHSYPHFSNCFRQRFGMSPAQYQKQHRNTL